MVPERRRNSRVKVDSLLPVDLGQENGGIVLNLSEGGLRVRVVGRLDTEEMTPLRFTLPECKNGINTLGQVAWVDEAHTGGGVRFFSLAEEARQQIQQWLALNAPASETQPQTTPIQPKATDPVESPAEQTEVMSWVAAQPPPEENFTVAGEFHPLLTESATFREFRLKKQQSLEQARREESRRRLIRAGVSACLLIVVVAAGAVLYRFQQERIQGFLGAIKEQLSASGVWPSESGQPTTTTTSESKSAPRAARRGRSKAQPGTDRKTTILSAAGPRGEAVGSARPSGPSLEVSGANGQRQLVPYHGTAVVRLKDWSTVQVHARAGKSTPAGATAPESASAASSTAPRASGREEASGELAEQRQMPAYPSLALQNNVQGSVVLRALIGKDGTIQNVQLVSGPPILASAVLDAVRKWRYRPYLRNGEPVEVERQITVEFTIFTNEPASKGQNTTGPRP